MKLSTRSRYGTRILVDLARNSHQGPVQIGEISKRQDISVKYLEQLIRPLKQANLVNSVRGPKGGHLLAKNPKDITLGQIVRLFEGQSELVECISNPQKCSMSDDCQVRLAWKEATMVLFEKLDNKTIADLMEETIVMWKAIDGQTGKFGPIPLLETQYIFQEGKIIFSGILFRNHHTIH